MFSTKNAENLITYSSYYLGNKSRIAFLTIWFYRLKWIYQFKLACKPESSLCVSCETPKWLWEWAKMAFKKTRLWVCFMGKPETRVLTRLCFSLKWVVKKYDHLHGLGNWAKIVFYRSLTFSISEVRSMQKVGISLCFLLKTLKISWLILHTTSEMNRESHFWLFGFTG